MQHISVSGPGCVKSRTGQKYVESISLLPSREGGYGTVRLLNRRNREGSSKRKLNFRLFTQPGPRADINRCTNRHRTAETFGQILSWLLETVRLRSAPELAVGARAEN